MESHTTTIYEIVATHLSQLKLPNQVLASTPSLTEASKICNRFLADGALRNFGLQEIRVVPVRMQINAA